MIHGYLSILQVSGQDYEGKSSEVVGATAKSEAVDDGRLNFGVR